MTQTTIPEDADLRGLLRVVLARHGGSLTFTHAELGEAAFAAFTSRLVITSSEDDDSVTVELEDRLVQDVEATDAG